MPMVILYQIKNSALAKILPSQTHNSGVASSTVPTTSMQMAILNQIKNSALAKMMHFQIHTSDAVNSIVSPI